jgi:hypothetical protein
MKRRVPSALVVLAFVTAGCGGSGSSSSAASVQWANDVCGATTAWKNQLSKLVGGVRAGGLSEESLKTAGSSLQAVTKTYAETLKDLGTPQTNAGTQAKQSIDTLATQLSRGADAIKQALDSSSASAALTTIATTVSSMQTNIKSAVSNLQSLDAKGELKQAFDSADNCASLTTS